MLNQQPIEKRELRQDGLLAVHSIFHTIQGEGPFCGTPCVFIRLAGCNLQCPACDTDYTSTRRVRSPFEILTEVNDLWHTYDIKKGLVVITGGEPFRQELSTLFSTLCANGYYVQVESNGTLEPPHCPPGVPWNYQRFVTLNDRKGVYIVCSPKTAGLNKRLVDLACALKYVVAYGQVEEDGLPAHALNHISRPMRPPQDWDRLVYVQPMDEQREHMNTLHKLAAAESCLGHGYTLQLQIHKLIGVE